MIHSGVSSYGSSTIFFSSSELRVVGLGGGEAMLKTSFIDGLLFMTFERGIGESSVTSSADG